MSAAELAAALSAELWDARLPAAALAVAVAGLVRGLTGFGGALVLVPILGLLYGPAPAVAMTIAIELAGYLQLLPGAARHIRWREVAPMGAAALLALPLGVWLVLYVPPDVMRRALGAIVLLLAALIGIGWRARRRPGLPAALGVAGMSGLLEGLAGTPGPPVVLFLYAGPDSAAANRHQLIGYFTVLDAAGLALFAWHGTLDGATLLRTALLIPLTAAGAWLGARLLHRASEVFLRRLALALIATVGLVGLYW